MEKKMEQEEKMRQKSGKRIPGAFMEDEEQSEDDMVRQMRMDRMRQMRGQDQEMAGDDDQDM